jgi:ABC-type dipeptide/oligopeptide/nickel transport system permease component
VVVTSVAIVVSNLLVDLAHARLDPRVTDRIGRGTR